MGLCGRCHKFIEPNLMFDEDDKVQLCVFCKVGKDQVTVELEGKDVIYTKKEAVKNYEVYLKVLRDKPEIKKHFAEEGAEKLIKVYK